MIQVVAVNISARGDRQNICTTNARKVGTRHFAKIGTQFTEENVALRELEFLACQTRLCSTGGSDDTPAALNMLKPQVAG